MLSIICYFLHTGLLVWNCVFLVALFYTMGRTALRDPGYIPKQVPPFAKGPLLSPTLAFLLQCDTSKQSPLETKAVQVPLQGQLQTLRYCESCKSLLRLHTATTAGFALF